MILTIRFISLILQKKQKKCKSVFNFQGFQYNNNMGKITDIKEGVKNKERLNIFVDGAFSFAVYIDTALIHHLKIGIELSDAQMEEIRRQDSEKYAVAIAMDQLSHKMRTEKELRDKLRSKEIPEGSVESAIEKLKELGYIDDTNYAQLFAQELLQKYGSRMAIQKMMLKGVPRELAEETVKGTAQDDDVIAGYVARLRQKYRNEEPYKAKQKMIRALMGKGFEYDDIRRAIGGEEE